MNIAILLKDVLKKDIKKRWSVSKLPTHPFIIQIGDGKKKDNNSQTWLKIKRT